MLPSGVVAAPQARNVNINCRPSSGNNNCATVTVEAVFMNTRAWIKSAPPPIVITLRMQEGVIKIITLLVNITKISLSVIKTMIVIQTSTVLPTAQLLPA